MSKLIGTNPNQVPSNADLGSAAFMDAKELLLSKGSSLSAINAIAHKTAVDIFIYNTSKDSDGGAWRKRTQHTSWYNETLNTSTRGSRKEFPAVAVIVLEDTDITIYDGDSPSLPMWMVFSANSIIYSSSNSSIHMLNGLLCSTNSFATGVQLINFVSDKVKGYRSSSATTFQGNWTLGIAGRNQGSGNWDQVAFNPTIINGSVHDVAMTVLPNARIDPATGLPTPTIAIGTSSGLSIIKDNGTIINRSTSFVHASSPGGVHDVSFDNNNGYWYTNCHYPPSLSAAPSHAAVLGHSPSIDTAGAIASSDNQVYSELMMAIGSNDGGNSTHWSSVAMPGVWMNHAGDSGQANAGYMEITPDGDLASRYGLHKFLPNYSDHSASAVNYITSNYNTGYMVGDIKLATLSDTDNTVGTELIENGTFSSNTTGWASDGSSTLSIDSGRLKVLGGYATQNFTTVVGETYVFTWTVTNGNDGGGIYLGTASSPYVYLTSGKQSTGQYSHTFIATTTATYIRLYAWDGGTDFAFFDNVSAKLAEVDRSINGNGLLPYGTVTKTPVATGADLMAYSFATGSSFAHYLYQPYTADLDFTNEFSISFWVKDWIASRDLLHRGPAGARNQKTSFHMYCDGGYDYRLTLSSNGSTEQTYEIPLDGNLTGWQNVCFTLSPSGVVKGYLNGELKHTANFTGTNIFSQATDKNGLYIGDGPVSASFGGSIALLRLSATAPAPEQIEKIYEDERHLFQENAKATLYGTSDAVTALAYDDDTKLLHAGTSAGRSVFKGLRRLDNTTDAVSVAISASNEMVAEE